MQYYREYRGYQVYLGDSADRKIVAWKVVGFGSERSSGKAMTRQQAFIDACASIDELEADPYRYPVNLIGYPKQSEGEVITSDGEFIGHWQVSPNEDLQFVEFIPAATDKVVFSDHVIPSLCDKIVKWHEGT